MWEPSLLLLASTCTLLACLHKSCTVSSALSGGLVDMHSDAMGAQSPKLHSGHGASSNEICVAKVGKVGIVWRPYAL